jgi:hypothetical protein
MRFRKKNQKEDHYNIKCKRKRVTVATTLSKCVHFMVKVIVFNTFHAFDGGFF